MAQDPGIAQIASLLQQQTQAQRDFHQSLRGVLDQVSKQSSISTTNIQRVIDKSANDLKDSFVDLDKVVAASANTADVDKIKKAFVERLDSQTSMFSFEKRLQSDRLRQLAIDINDNIVAGTKYRNSLEAARDESLKSQSESTKELDAVQGKYSTAVGEMSLNQAKTASASNRLAKTKLAYETSAIAIDAAEQARREAELAQLESDLDQARKHEKSREDHHSATITSYEKYRQQVDDSTQRLASTSAELAKITPALARNAAALAKTEQDFKRSKLGAAMDDVKSALLNGAKGMAKGLAVTGSTLFAKSIADTWKTVQTEINTGASIGGVSEAQTANLGLSRPEFAEMSAEYRRAMMATGGLTASMEVLNAAQKDLATTIADPKDITKFTLDQMQMMAVAGIRPATAAGRAMIKSAGESYASIQTITGQTAEAYMGTLRDIMDDESTQNELRRAANEDERAAILTNTAARLKENLAMGMTTAQATAVAKAMKASQAKGPMDRLKEAVKLQATMGAMGISGGQRAFELARKGKTTAAEDKELQGYRSNTANAISTGMANDEGMGIFTDALTQKTGVTEDSLAAYNTKALEAVAPAIKDGTAATAKVETHVAEGSRLLQDIKNQITKNPIVEAIVGALSFIGLNAAISANTIASGLNTAALMKSSGGGLGDLLGGKGGKLAKVGKGLAKGGALAIVGTAAEYGGDKLKDAGYKKTGGTVSTLGTAAQYAGMGAMIGSVVPGVGTAVGATIGGVAGFGMGMYDNWDDMRGNTYAQHAKIAETKPAAQKTKKTDEVLAKGIAEQTTNATDNETREKLTIDQQMNKMVEANGYLKTIADGVPTLVDLAGKQLLASTLTDKEKSDTKISKLRGSVSGLASQYQYI